jgi:hypothetical protein
MPVSRSNGVDIWYEVKGDGPAMVLVHAPGAVHKVLPGTGHACCLEDPAGFDALVIDFLQARKLMPDLRG